MSAFDVIGVIDTDFDTGYNVTHVSGGGKFVNGIWTETPKARTVYVANVQPLNAKELNFLQNGGERVIDSRKLYIDRNIEGLTLDSKFEFLGYTWKVFQFDARPENNYFKVIVARVDE